MADKRTDSGSDSETGDEPVVGNVNKFAVVPPAYSGRPKRGHLIFDACFESGNLGRVDYISEFEYDLFIRPDTCNPRFRVWFNFTVENVRSDQRAVFNIVNFSKTKSLYREGMSPVVKSTSRPKWVRIPAKHVYYYRCPDHRKNYVMSFSFCFDREDDVYQFSYCYPYTYTRLQTYLDNLEKRNMDYFQRELLCLSVQQRRMDLITISSPKNLDSTKQRVVFITSRVHPGETPASYLCQGIIDFLVSNHPISKALRDHVVFKIVPMLNPDGVYLGNYRCSLMGFDLNRHWLEPSPWAHPTLYACKNLITEMDQNDNLEVDFYLDIHAHSTLMNGFIYGNIYEDIDRCDRQSVFPKLLGSNAEDFSLSNTSFNRDPVKAGTGRSKTDRRFYDNLESLGRHVAIRCLRTEEQSDPGQRVKNTHHHCCWDKAVYFSTGLSMAWTDAWLFVVYGRKSSVIPDDVSKTLPNIAVETKQRTFGGSLDDSSYCYTMEVSFFSYQTASGQTLPYTEDGYMKLGRNIARTFLDYYKLIGYISTKPSSGMTPKTQNDLRLNKRGSVSDTTNYSTTDKRK